MFTRLMYGNSTPYCSPCTIRGALLVLYPKYHTMLAHAKSYLLIIILGLKKAFLSLFTMVSPRRMVDVLCCCTEEKRCQAIW